MSKYTAEQVAREADLQEDHVADMLRDYAALLRERESAKAAVTDEMVERACEAFEGPYHWEFQTDLVKTNTRAAMRRSLSAVAPMLASQNQEPMHNDPRAESGGAEEIAQWLYANGYHVAAYTIRTQLDIRNKMLASARVPDGWQLVPKKMDANMLREFRRVAGAVIGMYATTMGYIAALAAAPKPETEE